MVCLIDVRAVWVAVGGSGEPPFTVSMPDQASCRLVGGGVWVWLGGTLLLLVRFVLAVVAGAELGTLLGPEKTPCCWGCCSLAAPVWCV
jgi:hypothetical protein